MISEVNISAKWSEFQLRECPGIFLSCLTSLFSFRGWHILNFLRRRKFPGGVRGVGREFYFRRGSTCKVFLTRLRVQTEKVSLQFVASCYKFMCSSSSTALLICRSCFFFSSYLKCFFIIYFLFSVNNRQRLNQESRVWHSSGGK